MKKNEYMCKVVGSDYKYDFYIGYYQKVKAYSPHEAAITFCEQLDDDLEGADLNIVNGDTITVTVYSDLSNQYTRFTCKGKCVPTYKAKEI